MKNRSSNNRRGRVKEERKEGEYGCISYTRMNTEFLNL
jgi:hypothetical protein